MRKIEDTLAEAGQVIVDEMVRILTTEGKYPLTKQSNLVRSLRVEVLPQGRDRQGRFVRLQMVVLGAPYAGNVNLGRRPGRYVPAAELLKWVRQRRLRGRDAKGRFISNAQLVYLINRKIYRDGIDPRPFVVPALAKGQAYVEPELGRWVLDTLADESVIFNPIQRRDGT